MENAYYTIDVEIDRKIMGNCFPQIDTIAPSDVADSINAWEFPPDNTSFVVKMDKKSKQTDFLNNLQISGATGFFVSQAVKDIFDQFNLMKHKYYPTTIKGWDTPYYWLHLSEPKLTQLIDYSESIFYRTRFNSKKEQINLSDFSEYETLKKENGFSFGVSLVKTVSKNNHIKKLDMFEFLPFSDSGIYISEKLKSALEKNKITGFITQKADDLVIE